MSNVAEEDEKDDFLNAPFIIKRDYRQKPVRPQAITFVKAQDNTLSQGSKSRQTLSTGASYLSLVLPSHGQGTEVIQAIKVCDSCQLPLSGADGDLYHESSLAHQLCLEHTHPPLAIDRSRKGFSYLQSQGWNPEARKGLGQPAREGILYPITTKEKNNKAGLGTIATPVKVKVDKIQKLNAKDARILAKKDKERNEKLQRMFYSNGELEKYLGPDAL